MIRKASAAPSAPIVGTSTALATALATRPNPVHFMTKFRLASTRIGVMTSRAAVGTDVTMRIRSADAATTYFGPL